MNGGSDVLLAAERAQLRARLQLQRQLITQRLGTTPASPTAFPRSITMGFLTRHPILTRRVLLGVASGLLAAVTAARARRAASHAQPSRGMVSG